MFDRLIDTVLQFADLFKFWQVIDEYERGVVLRFGKFHRTLEPGIHWLIPFAVDNVITDNVVSRTTVLGSLDLTTHEDQPLRVEPILRWKIHDIRKVLLEVEGLDDVIRDASYGIVSRLVRERTWEEVIQPSFQDTLTKECRKRAWRYGVEIEEVMIGDLVRPIHIALLQ